MGSIRLLAIALVVATSAASVMVPTSSSAGNETEVAGTETSGELDLPPLPQGSTDRSRAGAEQSAIDLAAALEAVVLPPETPDAAEEDAHAEEEDAHAEELGEPCPRDRLAVSWEEPGPEYEHGAFTYPVGPPPTADTDMVNGIVFCDGETYSYMGFEAIWFTDEWEIFAVPDPDFGSDHDHGNWEELLPPSQIDLQAVMTRDVSLTNRWIGRWGPDIEGYAPYAPQRVCDPRPKPGTVAFTEMVLAAYPDTANWGISRDCGVGGRSEHKEGRAWDWRVDVYDDRDRQTADEVISWLMATDEFGNSHAMARRLGVMYIIWNRKIWSSSSPAQGWRPYFGASPHTDHVHISFAPDGALGRTSFWEGVDLDSAAFGDNPFAGFPSAFPPGTNEPPTTREQAAERREEQRRVAERRERERQEREEREAEEAGQDDVEQTVPDAQPAPDSGPLPTAPLPEPTPLPSPGDPLPSAPSPPPVSVPDPIEDATDSLTNDVRDVTESTLDSADSLLP
jgi:hypothetical protein